MKPLLLSLFLLFFGWTAKTQTTYFPPANNNAAWDSISTENLGWCSDSVTSLLNYLDQRNTKAFVILVDGKVAIQHYFGTFKPDSIWYWASAGKTIISYLTGIAQQQNLLSISEPSNNYLGAGFTSCTPTQENAITIQHHLSMATGLNDSGVDLECTTPNCLTYLAPPNTRWSYHNAPYKLLHNVLESASGKSLNLLTTQELKQKIGMQSGFWFDEVFYSNALDMARFGLLYLNSGWWAGNQLLTDTAYLNQSISSSQSVNQSYGYLWWLNGKNSFMLPQSQFVFQGSIIPNAPADLYAALGKNDQKIYVVPSKNMVVVRLGNQAIESGFALTAFDNELWGKIETLACTSSTQIEDEINKKSPTIQLTNRTILIPNDYNNLEYAVYSISGKLLQKGRTNSEIHLNDSFSGMMILKLENGVAQKFVLY